MLLNVSFPYWFILLCSSLHLFIFFFGLISHSLVVFFHSLILFLLIHYLASLESRPLYLIHLFLSHFLFIFFQTFILFSLHCIWICLFLVPLSSVLSFIHSLLIFLNHSFILFYSFFQWLAFESLFSHSFLLLLWFDWSFSLSYSGNSLSGVFGELKSKWKYLYWAFIPLQGKSFGF